MIDRRQIRDLIASTPAGGRRPVILTRDWLEQVERELATGAAALAELAALRAQNEAQA